MKLIELSAADRDAIARAIGCSSKYLYQVAAGVIDAKTGKPRKLGADLARRAVAFDGRLRLEELRPDIWGGLQLTGRESGQR